MTKARPMTQSEFENLPNRDNWIRQEIPKPMAVALGLSRAEDTIVVIASGSTATQQMHGRPSLYGIDVLAVELRPEKSKAEPDGNAYHYIVTPSGHAQYPYLLVGPFTSGACIQHWYDDLDLDDYIANVIGELS